ncbi:MAG: acetylxylan esterase [Armatimonadetes bacterium]|nr:acetylxylan esterase [Armatimonadota bacterium]
MVWSALVRRARELSSRSLAVTPTPAAWRDSIAQRRRQWREMLGLDPLPPRTELHATQTGLLERGSYVIEKLHLQPVAGCYLAANLYRPKDVAEPLPGVVYVCGHSPEGKASAYQAHARWFGEHGYVCLILDTIEIGESTGDHHGTYHRGWWQWYSQGYSAAGVEVWYAMRAADYLQSREDVDGSRLGITGLSGGGAVSWFTGAADDRFGVVAPACQTGSMVQHLVDRTLDGHCDCAVWPNVYGWDLADVGALIAPRALMVASATEDTLWRPWSNRELLLRVRRLYRRLGIEDRFDVVEDIGPHGYTAKHRLALFSWFERHLKDAGQAIDDLVDEREPVETLQVFAAGKPPEEDRTPDVHRLLIALPEPPRPADRGGWEAHQREALAKLDSTTFRHIPRARELPSCEAGPRGWNEPWSYTTLDFETEPGLRLRATLALPIEAVGPVPVVVAAVRASAPTPVVGQGTGLSGVPAGMGYAAVEVRGTGNTALGPGTEWTARRAYPLLGCSLPERRTLDLLRGLDVICAQVGVGPVSLFGTAETAATAIYAALLDPRVGEVILREPVTTHWDGGPEFCMVLQVGDLPHNAALLWPRRVTFVGAMPEAYEYVREVYTACGGAERVRVVGSLREWAG